MSKVILKISRKSSIRAKMRPIPLFLIISGFILQLHPCRAQTYCNEWINYSQKYYKIKVVKDGVYRIDSSALAGAGIPVNTINPKNFQLFFRGREQYIYIQEFGGVFNHNSYIEFYGQGNDGALDSLVYNSGHSPNPYYSLFSDTAVYYLTWNNSVNNYRMSEYTDTAFGGFTAASYFMEKTVDYGSKEFYNGRRYLVGGLTASDPRFTGAEGWFNSEIDLGGAATYKLNINPSLIYSSGPNAVITTLFTGESDAGFTPDHNISITNSWGGAPIDTIFCDTFPVITKNIQVPAATLAGSPNVSLTFASLSAGLSPQILGTGNITAVSYISAVYPQIPNLGGYGRYMLYMPDGVSGGAAFLSLTNVGIANNADTVRFYDLTNHRRIRVSQTGLSCRILIPNSGGIKQCYITSDDSIYHVNVLLPVGSSANGLFTQYVPADMSKVSYLIISHPKLWSVATSYAAYRNNTGYDAVLANIEELYDQFAYGVEQDPLAIRNFCNNALHKWRNPPQYLLLLGKGIRENLARPDTATVGYTDNLIPSWGVPSSDIYLTSGLIAKGLAPALATGRVPAANTLQASTYLTKVQTFESTPYAQWMKKVIHFGGGGNYTEQQQFLNYLNSFASIIMKPYFGANVYTFLKSTPAPIQITLADSVKNLINNGVSLMTFFGHASGSNFDVSLDAPSDYTNYGKYPMIIGDACFSGDIFEPEGEAISNTSEQFTLEFPGAIAFLATDDLGVPGYLVSYTQNFYQDIDTLMWRKPIGKSLQNTIGKVYPGYSSDIVGIMTILEMTLNGDPAITFMAKDSLPDYAVTDTSVYFTPPNVTTQLDSFKVNVVVYNLAEAVTQPVQVSVTRIFPTGATQSYMKTFQHVYYQDTLSITMPVNNQIGVGLNKFLVQVDPNNLCKEMTKTNNNLLTPAQLLISSGDIVPIYPYQFAIIPTDTITLKASTGDPNAPSRRYVFQIDTTIFFNSPWLKSQVVSSPGGVVCANQWNWQNTPPGTPYWNITPVNSNPHKPLKLPQIKHENIPALENSQPSPAGHSPGTVAPVNSAINIAPAENSIKGAQTPVKQNGANVNHAQPVAANNLAASPLKHIVTPPPSFIFKDSTVYYWRVMRDTNDFKDFFWENSSFQYITGKTGWAQAHYYQFDNNYYTYINQDIPHRRWLFSPTGVTLQCTDYGVPPYPNYNNYYTQEYGTEYLLNLTTEGTGCCQLTDQLMVGVIDGVSLQPWFTGDANNQFGEANDNGNGWGCSPGNKFIFWTSVPSEMTGLKNMLKAVPNGDYILIYSFWEANFQHWSDTGVRGVIASLGGPSSATFASYSDSVPWIFFVRKGSPNTAVNLLGTNKFDSLRFTTTLTNNEDFGSDYSPVIGPAQHWDSLSWRQYPLVTKNQDSARLNIIGINNNDVSNTLFRNISPQVANMYLTSINAKQYPELQLMEYTKDTLTHTPSQMNKWQVFFTPVPEVAVNPSILYPSQASYFHKDTMQAGDTIRYETVVQNISPYTMDSMAYNAWILDQSNVSHPLPVKHTKILNPGDTTMISAATSSVSYPGANSIWFEVNPASQPLTRAEQYHFNNFAWEYFNVQSDGVNPLLDVTFDGVHILNGDIVSPHPNILITLKDLNQFLALNSPSDFAVFIRNVNTPTATQVFVGNQMSFTPAILPDNSCKLIYTPTLPDGTYELTVQAKNASGIASGPNGYVIDFQVINKSMISNVVNYPNPFSTSTKFVFTLTGEQIPTYFKIQIMTVTGKVIREITEGELGPIHIGRNITSGVWDGTDRFGDRVANGVYLYRVITSLDGQSLDHYSTDADQYFTHGWGKMYLMR